MEIPRMRTMPECVRIIKEVDPDSPITYWTLRRWVKEGILPTVKSGNREYINLDDVIALMMGTKVVNIQEVKQKLDKKKIANETKQQYGNVKVIF